MRYFKKASKTAIFLLIIALCGFVFILGATAQSNATLYAAASNGQTKTALALIEAGVDVNAKGKDGWAALLEAAKNGHTEIEQALVEAGATQ